MIEHKSTDIDTNLLPRVGRQVQSGVLESLPHHLQQDSLLGVHILCISRGDAKEGGIKGADVMSEEVTSADIGLPFETALEEK